MIFNYSHNHCTVKTKHLNPFYDVEVLKVNCP